MKTPAAVSIVIVSWNVRNFLEACLRSIYRQTATLPIEVIVVDNGSSDGTPDMVEQKFPGVRLFRYGENLGFTRANNVALGMILREKTSRYILLLNSDTEIQDRGIEELAAYLDRRPEAGAVAPANPKADDGTRAGIARAPAMAEETATDQAIFENGSNWVNPHAHRVQSGYPGGDDTPPYAAAVDQTPELSKPTSGASVKR